MTPDEHDELCILLAARLLIDDPETWTQRVSACDKRGRWVFSTDPRACCWCAAGACRAVVPNSPDGYISPEHCELVERVYARLPDLVDINDFEGRKAALRYIDGVIAQLEAA